MGGILILLSMAARLLLSMFRLGKKERDDGKEYDDGEWGLESMSQKIDVTVTEGVMLTPT